MSAIENGTRRGRLADFRPNTVETEGNDGFHIR